MSKAGGLGRLGAQLTLNDVHVRRSHVQQLLHAGEEEHRRLIFAWPRLFEDEGQTVPIELEAQGAGSRSQEIPIFDFLLILSSEPLESEDVLLPNASQGTWSTMLSIVSVSIS